MAKTQKTPQQKAAETRKANAAKKAAEARNAGRTGPSDPVDGLMGTLPLVALLCGAHARRANWQKGVTIFVGDVGGRGGRKPALMMTGARGGHLPYRPQLTTDDDLLAEDWEVVEEASAS